MVLVSYNGKEYYMDGYLKANLDYVKKRVLEHNNMLVCIIDGRVGTGKSTLASQCAYYCSDGSFDTVHECFTLEQFEKVLKESKKGDAIVLDEAFEILNKRKTQSTANMQILSMLQQMRAKQVFIFIVLPSIYDLDKNLILNISDLLLHCYRKDFGRRGQFACYNRQNMKELWIRCRQNYSYPRKIAKPNFIARFTGYFPIGYEAYEKKKISALEKGTKEATQSEFEKYNSMRNTLVKNLREKGFKYKEIEGLVGLKRRQLHNIIHLETPQLEPE